MAHHYTAAPLLLALAAALLLLVSSPYRAEASISTCNSVYNFLLPCVPYVTGSGNPSSNCCGGIKNLLAAASTTADRQMACNCIEDVAGSAPPGYMSRAVALPDKCNVNLPFKISPDIDCSKIN